MGIEHPILGLMTATIILTMLVGAITFMAIFQYNVQELIITTPRTESYVKCFTSAANNYTIQFIIANSGGSDLKLERLHITTDQGILEVQVTGPYLITTRGDISITVILRGFAGVELWRGQLGTAIVILSSQSPLYTIGRIYNINAYFKTIMANYETFIVAGGTFKPGGIPECAPEPILESERVSRSAIYFDTFDTNPFTRGVMKSLYCKWGHEPSWEAVNVSSDKITLGRGLQCYAFAIDNISQYIRNGDKVYIAVVIWRPSYSGVLNYPDIFYATAYTDNYDNPRMLYAAGYRNTVSPGRNGDITNASVWRWRSGGPNWDSIGAETRIPGLGVEEWYASPVVSMLDGSRSSIYVYNVTPLTSGSDVREDILSITRVGLVIRVEDFVPPGQNIAYTVAYFDNLVVTINRPPWFVNVTGLMPGWIARINVNGTIISWAVADENGVAAIPLWLGGKDGVGCRDLLNSACRIYKDSTFIVKDGVLEVGFYDGNGNFIVIASYIANPNNRDSYIVGGDLYKVGPLS